MPHAGKRFVGNFITYHTTGDNKPIEIPDGQNEARHHFRVFVPTADASIHMYLDEIPDLSLYVVIKQENGPFQKEFQGAENEYMQVDNLAAGYYIISLVKRRGTPGGNIARYVPTIWVVPSVKEDNAGNSMQRAKNIGELSSTPFEFDEFLQAVLKRKRDGQPDSDHAAIDSEDWFRFTTSRAGLIKATLRKTAVLDSDQMTVVAEYANGTTPVPVGIPSNGLAISPGTHFVRVRVPAQANADNEYGLKYHLSLAFEPR